jgi:hypothetical protein
MQQDAQTRNKRDPKQMSMNDLYAFLAWNYIGPKTNFIVFLSIPMMIPYQYYEIFAFYGKSEPIDLC